MKKSAFLVSLICLFVSTSHAELVRQAQLTATIEKVVYVVGDNGMPSWARTPICTKQALINVYKEERGSWTDLRPEDLSRIQCDSEIFGQKVSVTIGAAVGLFNKQMPSGVVALKSTAMFLSWGNPDLEVPKLVHAPSSDPWLSFQDVLSPVSTGKIVDGVPQPPEPSEFFSAVIYIEDESR